ncbi:YiiX/YebB-like N1pC/P60 family cysteine hydrolase [Vibrio sp. PP-XX7]
MDNIIDMKAGDILFSRRKSAPSGLLRFFTVSDWSRVAIAISSNCVLEATREKGVDDISLEEFLDNNDSVILFRRSGRCASQQLRKKSLKRLCH